jgi:hypothetical protein
MKQSMFGFITIYASFDMMGSNIVSNIPFEVNPVLPFYLLLFWTHKVICLPAIGKQIGTRLGSYPNVGGSSIN